MSLVNYDLQNTVIMTQTISTFQILLKQPCGVSKTAVSEHITLGAVRYRLIVEGSKESDI